MSGNKPLKPTLKRRRKAPGVALFRPLASYLWAARIRSRYRLGRLLLKGPSLIWRKRKRGAFSFTLLFRPEIHLLSRWSLKALILKDFQPRRKRREALLKERIFKSFFFLKKTSSLFTQKTEKIILLKTRPFLKERTSYVLERKSLSPGPRERVPEKALFSPEKGGSKTVSQLLKEEKLSLWRPLIMIKERSRVRPHLLHGRERKGLFLEKKKGLLGLSLKSKFWASLKVEKKTLSPSELDLPKAPQAFSPELLKVSSSLKTLLSQTKERERPSGLSGLVYRTPSPLRPEEKPKEVPSPPRFVKEIKGEESFSRRDGEVFSPGFSLTPRETKLLAELLFEPLMERWRKELERRGYLHVRFP